MKTITLKYQGTTYTLKYTLASIKRLADKGFSIKDIEDIADKPWAIMELFYGSFIAEHPGIPVETMDSIYAHVPNKQEFFTKLAECYAEPLESLMKEPGDDSEGNATWGASW